MRIYAIDLSRDVNDEFFSNLALFTGNERPVSKRITEIAIELFQNIRRYSATLANAKLEIVNDQSDYACRSVNTIASSAVTALTETIRHINTLDRNALKSTHTKILACSLQTKNNNPGLGLYRIALRSDAKLNASFTQLDADRFELSLHVNLAAPQ